MSSLALLGYMHSPLMFFPLAPLTSSVFHDPNTMSLMPDFSTGG